MKSKLKKGLAVVLAGTILASSVTPALAGEPEVSVDETAYITMDYYGNRTDLSIVKSVRLNGCTEFTDYGRYDVASNLSTTDRPSVSDEGVTWSLSDPGKDRFYFEVQPRDQFLGLPWSIDVSYMLDGVPYKAEDLAGKSGLVEIDVTVTPDPLADEYYKNNFILVCGTGVDLGETKSFRAEGAQLQTLGSYQLAAFMAFPGQEEHFHFEIGSDDFTFPGLIFASVPVTLSQVDDLSEMGKDKDDIKAAGDAIDGLLRDTLDIMTSMTAGTAQAAEGLRDLEKAWDEVDQQHDSIQDSVDSTRYAMKNLKNHLYDLAEVMDDSSILDGVGELEDAIDGMLGSLEQIGQVLEQFHRITSEIKDCIKIINAPSSSPEKKLQAQMKMAELLKELEELLGKLQGIDLDGLSVQTDDLHSLLKELDQGVTAGSVETESIDALMGALADLEDQIKEELEASQEELEDITTFTEPSERSSLEDIDFSGDVSLIQNELVMVIDNTARTVSKLEVAMGKIDQVLNDSYDNLNSGIRSTLSGTAQLMESLTASLQKTRNIKANEQIISDLLDKNWQKLDDELGILNMDPSARKPSFTSARNPEPDSVQVILRTESITKPEEDVEDVNEDGDNRTFLQRLGDVFQKIWNTITGLFK